MTIGDKIPAILGKNQAGKEIKASDFNGKKLILYFYPKDNTPGCSAEACSLRNNYSIFQDNGYAVVGVSVDSAASHQKFIESKNLPFDLIADEDNRLVKEFGVWIEKTMFGNKYMRTLRQTFIINEEGVIEKIYYPQSLRTTRHGEQIRRDLIDKKA
ncbi:MAG: peroxiredoxin [Bacteroidales bacterium]|nr:peroxiredoxin [Bacteroidales bacterium]